MDFYVSKELPYQLNMNIKAGLIKICMYLYFIVATESTEYKVLYGIEGHEMNTRRLY